MVPQQHASAGCNPAEDAAEHGSCSSSVDDEAAHAVLPEADAQEGDYQDAPADHDAYIAHVVPGGIHALLTAVIRDQCAAHDPPAVALDEALKCLADDEKSRLRAALHNTRSFEGRVLYNQLVGLARAGKGRGRAAKGGPGCKGTSLVLCRNWMRGSCKYDKNCKFTHVEKFTQS